MLLFNAGFLLRISLAGTVAFIAGTTRPHRITMRHFFKWFSHHFIIAQYYMCGLHSHGVDSVTVINFSDTQCQWAVIQCSNSCLMFNTALVSHMASIESLF